MYLMTSFVSNPEIPCFQFTEFQGFSAVSALAEFLGTDYRTYGILVIVRTLPGEKIFSFILHFQLHFIYLLCVYGLGVIYNIIREQIGESQFSSSNMGVPGIKEFNSSELTSGAFALWIISLAPEIQFLSKAYGFLQPAPESQGHRLKL